MTSLIARRDGEALTVCQLDSKMRASFLAAWRLAGGLLQNSNVLSGAQLITSEGYPQLQAGVRVLKEMGARGIVAGNRNQIHYALEAAYLTALRATIKLSGSRMHVRRVLQFLTEAVSYQLTISQVPGAAEIASFSRWSLLNQRTYRKIHREFLNGVYPAISVGDACRLLDDLPIQKAGRLRPLLKNLLLITASYRAALIRLISK